MLWLGAAFFVLAALTRQMAPVYVAGVIVLVGYLFAASLLGDMENKTLAALVDPSGATAVDVYARYWSVAQKNAQEIPFAGELLWNRALWLGVGAVGARVRLLRIPHADRGGRALAQGAGGGERTGDRGARRRAAGAGRRPQRGRVRAHAARAHAPVPRGDPAQPALPHDRAGRRADGRRQCVHAGLVLRHQHLPADVQGARHGRAGSSASSS